MEGTYPVILDDQLVGKLTVWEAGLLTRFRVQCAMQPQLTRVSVYDGAGEELNHGYSFIEAEYDDCFLVRS